MKIKFLGTGASEGIPDLFCRCAVCEKARLHKGRENRTRAGLMVDDDLLIDFSPDFFSNSIKFGIDGNKIETLLITHSHSDHFYVDDIVNSMLSSKNRKKIDIYSNEIVIDRLKKEIDSANLGENFGLHCVESYRTFHVGRRKITAFNAVHMPDERALLYFIEDGNRGYLHLYDTGEVKNEIAEWMQKNGKAADIVAIDCTFGTIEEKYFGHMNLKQAAEECEKLKKRGIIKDNAKIFATHFCHWGGSYEELCKAAEGTGITIVYDGLEVVVK